MAMSSCTSCDGKSLSRDPETSNLSCTSCGRLQDFDSYDAQAWNTDGGPQGVIVRNGIPGTGSFLPYREKKLFTANNIIDDITSRLNLSSRKIEDVKTMISNITEGEFGLGNWFHILVGACAYVTMRLDGNSFSMEEISKAIGCDVHELGRMVKRVVHHLDMKLPEFDIVNSFEKALKNAANKKSIDTGKAKMMREQGVLLIQCSVKWFLTTGRRPLPIVVAVLVFVAELNGVEDFSIDEVAVDLSVKGATCKLRYKELLEMIVKVARQALPWGKDVTLKNAVKNAPYVMHYLEEKSMEKRGGKGVSAGFDLEEVIGECLRKDVEYVADKDEGKYHDSQYFELQHKNKFDKISAADVNKLQVPHDCMARAYNRFFKDGHSAKHAGEIGKVNPMKRKRELKVLAAEWWNGKSELSKKLMLKHLLEKDVGFNTPPPSFINGCMKNEKRRAKINAAKQRINGIMHPLNAESGDAEEVCILEAGHAQKRREKSPLKGLDWEDFITETLLLHQVKEEEIMTGQYNTLIDLYVFNDGSI